MKIYRILLMIITIVSFSASAYAAPITSPFGWRVHPISGEWKFHSGMDIGYEEGTAIPAMMPGTVVYSAWYDGYGYTVIP